MSMASLAPLPASVLVQDHVFNVVFPARQHLQSTPQSSPHIGGSSSSGETNDDPQHDGLGRDLTRREAARSTAIKWLSLAHPVSVKSTELDDAIALLAQDSGSGRHDGWLHEWVKDEVRQFCHRTIESELKRIWTTMSLPQQAEEVLSQTIDLLRPRQSKVLNNIDLWLSENDYWHMDKDEGHRARQQFVLSLRQDSLLAMHDALSQWIRPEALHSCLVVFMGGAIQSFIRGDPVAHEACMMLQEVFELGLDTDIGQRALAEVVHIAIESYVESFAMRVDWIGRSGRTVQLREWVTLTLRPAALRVLAGMLSNTTSETPQDDHEQWHLFALTSLGLSRQANLLEYVQQWPRSTGAILDLREYIALPGAKQRLARDFSRQLTERVCHAGASTAELLGIYVAMIGVFKTLDNRSVLLEKVARPIREYLRGRDDTVRVIAASFLAILDENDKLVAGAVGADEICEEITREVLRSETSTAQPSSALDWDDMSWLPHPIDAGPDYRSTKSNDVISYMLSLFDRDAFVGEVQNILGERLLRTEAADLQSEVRLIELLKSRLGVDKMQAAEVMVRDMADSVRIAKVIVSTAAKERQLPSARDMYYAIPPTDGISFGELVDKMQLGMPSNAHLKAKFIAVVKEAAMPGPEGKTHLLFRNSRFIDPEPMGGHVAGDSATGDGTKSADAKIERFEAKILSSFFWPQLRDDQFKVPRPVTVARQEFEAGFKRIKVLRRLDWLSALGRATVEIELADRTIKVEGVKTWVAAVAYAFEEEEEDKEDAGQDQGVEVDMMEKERTTVVGRTVAQLQEQLDMDEVLVRNALSFWVGHKVLRDTGGDRFEVVETLTRHGEAEDSSTTTRADAGGLSEETAVSEAGGVSALKSQEALLKSNKGLYEVFVIGMLTNGGAMDAGRMAMMLKMVVPGGFAFGEEEVTWLLTGMESEGKVERRGEAWAVKK